MLKRDGYPAGVPCWIDLVQPDPDATMAFYGDLFEWEYEPRTPPEAPSRYAYARKEGLIVAGVGGPPAGAGDPSGWTTYMWVDSADAAVDAVVANGGQVVTPAVDIPRAGRVAVCSDPAGAVFGVWQAAENRGAELVNAPGSWNFSDLTTPDIGSAEKFYGAVFGWERDPFEMSDGDGASIWRVPGYGEFLAERDPELRERQAAAEAPGGFADAVAILNPEASGSGGGVAAGWNVTFAVADADGVFARAVSLGATVVTPLFDTTYTRMGTVKDPQGAVLTLSEYRPPVPASGG
jgi:predicted enzyme related to lactoylglutathione lyase